MRITSRHEVNNADAIATRNEVFFDIEAAIRNAPGPKKGSWSGTKKAFQSELARNGWAVQCGIEMSLNLKITAMKDGVGVSFQTGNIARAAYDVLKLCGAYGVRGIQFGVLIAPVGRLNAAGNKAYFERIAREADFLLGGQSMPLLVLGIDDTSSEE